MCNTPTPLFFSANLYPGCYLKPLDGVTRGITPTCLLQIFFFEMLSVKQFSAAGFVILLAPAQT